MAKVKKRAIQNKEPKRKKIALPLVVYTESCALTEVVTAQKCGMVYVLGRFDLKKIEQLLASLTYAWQKIEILKKEKDFVHFSGPQGPVWILAKKGGAQSSAGNDINSEPAHAWYRDHMGSVLTQAKHFDLQVLTVDFQKVSKEIERASLLGLNLAAYHYKTASEANEYKEMPKLKFTKKLNQGNRFEAEALARAMNSARHLVNLPPNLLNPQSYANLVKETFASNTQVRVEVWQADRLQQEGMGLHLGVGQGSPSAPCLVHIRYRPTKAATRRKKPIAIVGKGITFDSGGLDIKPSSGMRLMKKDMGGSAAALALAIWATASKYPRAMDFYLALAENSVDGLSMRPSDVLTARNGMQIEIHNTDAEGRLVLADALDVAVTQKAQDEPELVLNFATLTGACRVALGAEIAGLFSNNEKLGEQLHAAGLKTGDYNWRLPLFAKYTSGFTSQFAELVNATDGFAGAITAALFLQKFIREKPWAHFDTYAWNDKPTGALPFVGGNAQTVQAVVEFLKNRK